MAGVVCQELRKSYGSVQALDGVSFAVEPGKVLALLGSNGSGKTTTVRVLTTLARPDSGSATVAGRHIIEEAQAVRRAIGLTAQETVIDGFLTGEEYMSLIARLRKLPRAQRASVVNTLLGDFGLSGVARTRVGAYSGGMRRRLDLAASFIGDPAVLFLDEPSNGLDPHSRQSLWDAVRRRADEGATVVLTTQYMEEADALADLAVVLSSGRVIVTGTPSELKDEMGGRIVELILADLRAVGDANAILASLGIRATIKDDRPDALHFNVARTDGALLMVLQSLESNGIGVADVIVRRPTLDEVFIRLTGETGRSAGLNALQPTGA